MLPTMHLPHVLPSNLIRKGMAASTVNPDHLLNNLLFTHLAAHDHNIISHLHDIPDDRQCVRHTPPL